MATLALGIAGAAAGSALGGPLGASIGFQIGSAVGNLLFPEKVQGPRLDDLKLHNSSYGQMTPRLWGTIRVAGNIIDQQPELTEHEETSGGKGGPEVTNYKYTCSFAVRLCERVGTRNSAILGIRRIWRSGRLVYDRTGGTTVDNEALPMTIYLGTEDQLPDPTLETIHGAGNVPGYRGVAYVVFTDLDLTPDGNTLPVFNFEVYTSAGTIPERISTFDPAPDGVSGIMGASFDVETGVMTVGTYVDGGSGGHPSLSYSQHSYDLQGNEVGTPIVDEPMVGAVSNANVCYITNANIACFPTGSGLVPPAWFVNGVQTVTILSGSWPYGKGVVQGDFLYCTSGPFPATLMRYPCADGIPAAQPDMEISVGGNGSDYDFGTSDNGDILVWNSVSHTLVEYNSDYEVQQTWLSTDFPSGFLPTAVYGFNSIIRYGDVLAFSYAGLGLDKLNLIQIESDNTLSLYPQDRSISDVPSYEYARGPIIGLTGGYVLGLDGVTLLDPPLEGVPLSEIVGDISLDCGFEETDVDVSALTDLVDGYQVTQQATGRDWIQPLRDAWFFDIIEEDDVAKGVKRGSQSLVTIPDDDLAAHQYEQEPPPIVGLTRGDELTLPQTVNVSYIDGEADYQTGSQYDRRQVTLSKSEVTLDLQINMTGRKARSVAQAQLYTAWIERNKIGFHTSRKYSKYSPTDVVTVRGMELRLVEKNEANGGVIEWKAVQALSQAFTQPGVPVRRLDFTTSPPTVVVIPSDVTALLLDLPLVNETDEPNGFYAAMRPSATLFKSSDGGSTYSNVATAATPAVIGTTSDTLGPFYGGNVFDESNVVTVVTLDGGELASTSETAVLNGANEAVVGDEVIQFKNAELVDTDTYELSGLLRGRLGTEWAIDGHGSGERFALLPTLRVPSPFSELNASRLYKPVRPGATLAGADSQGFTNTGNSLRPYSPVLLGGGTDASGNVTLQWTRRTRIGGAWAPFSDVPLSESSEAYKVQIWNSDYTQVARVIDATTQTATYTAAQQVTDFGALQQTIYFTVGQVGAVFGRQVRGTAVGGGVVTGNPLSAIPPYQSPTSGSPSPPPDLDALELAITWANPGNQRVLSRSVGNFACDKIVVASFTTPAGTAPNVIGSISAANYSSGTGYVMRTACLSTVPGDFSGNDLGANSRVVSISPWINFSVGTNDRWYPTPELAPNTTYYFNVKNDNGFGACTCFSADCDIFVELRKPLGL